MFILINGSASLKINYFLHTVIFNSMFFVVSHEYMYICTIDIILSVLFSQFTPIVYFGFT